MEVILKQDVDKIGKIGAVVKVKDGFARNFLFPNKLAIPLNSANLKVLEQEKEKKSVALEKALKESEIIKEKLSGISLTIQSLVKEEDKLYGSITSHDISLALKEEGLDIDKNIILLDEPIKALGIYEVPVKLHPEVSAKVKVWIVKK
ncbi:MAG: 50S ribosomal protein L9 [Candidatus Omnitrophica bacterium]|nr:50S ribosomal protein L9 [Candidatus Omnitrophota bacterium]